MSLGVRSWWLGWWICSDESWIESKRTHWNWVLFRGRFSSFSSMMSPLVCTRATLTKNWNDQIFVKLSNFEKPHDDVVDFFIFLFFCKKKCRVLTCKHITIIRLYKAHITTFCLSVNIFVIFHRKNYNSKSKHAFLFVVLESQTLYQLLWHRKSRNPSWQLVVRYWCLY